MISQSEFLLALIIMFFSAVVFVLFHKRKYNKTSNNIPSPPSIPIIGHLHLFKPLIHQGFRDLSLQYGPLLSVRAGSARFVVASSPEIARELLKTNELTFSSRKTNIAIHTVTYANATFTFSPFNNYWKFIKKLSTTQLLGTQTLRQFRPIRNRELHQLVRTLADKSKANESVNLAEALLTLSNNIISKMMLSIKGSENDGHAKQARALVREVTLIFGEFNISDFLGFCKNMDLQGVKKRAMDILRRYDALLEKLISDREESRTKLSVQEEVKDFLDVLLDIFHDKDAEVKLTRNNVKSVILDYLTAATDTTATAVEWIIAELFNNPRVLRKAQEELDRVIGNQRLVCEEDNSNLPYINAIIKETMRLHPPIPMIMRKGVEDCVVSKNMMIKKGSIVCVNIWAIGRDPKIWENPLEFKPERFLEGEGSDIDMKGHHFELLTFGSGRRGCPGMPLIMQELPTIIAALTQCFEWKMVDSQGKILENGKTINMDERPGLIACRANDLICIPVARFNPTPLLQV